MMPDLDTRLKEVAVVGASGKMGRGISLLILQQMTINAIKAGKEAFASFHLRLIDSNSSAYFDLKEYLKEQLIRFGEKNIYLLRKLFENDLRLVSNEEMIKSFAEIGLNFVDCSSELNVVKGSSLVFEAVFEEIPLKTALLTGICQSAPLAYVFTNTSSIPIEILAKASGLKSSLIGYHFYNPPAVQKLLEIIPSEYTSEELEKIAIELGTRLDKTMIYSLDVAGFIGNGHFAREIVYASSLVKSLSSQYSIEEAVQIVDAVTRDYLLRPMGIFQLLDYVGLTVVNNILEIIKLDSVDLIKSWMDDGLLGGQSPTGLPKDGIFRYENGKQEAIWSCSAKSYIPLFDLSFLGKIPFNQSWKKIQKNPEMILDYFKELLISDDLGAKLAKNYLIHSKGIVNYLVDEKIAKSVEDVGVVLKKGFFHLYSPNEVV